MSLTYDRLLRLYERGLLTEVGLSIDLVLASGTPPTDELVARLPPGVVDHIRRFVTAPDDGWNLVRVERSFRFPWVDDEQTERERWPRGLQCWRAYFSAEGGNT